MEEEEYRTSPLVSPVQHVAKTVDGAAAFPADGSALDPLELEKRLQDDQISDEVGSSLGPLTQQADPIAEPTPEADDDNDMPLPASPEWHDAYRLERTPSTQLGGGGDAGSDRLAWGWGALPHMQSSVIDQDADATTSEQLDDDLTGTEHQQEEEEARELPVMVKSESVYFDAVDSDALSSGAFGAGRYSEFLSSNSLIDLDPASLEANVPYISLCGHLLGTASSHEEMLSIFASHVVSFESFRADPTAILASPNLVALINGQLSAFTPEVQACLISRVLFPYSPPLPLNAAIKTRPTRGVEYPAARRQDHHDEGEEDPIASKEPVLGLTDHVKERHRSSFSLPALDPVDEVSSEGGASTQDTSSFTTEPYFKKSLLPSQADLRRMNLRAGLNDLSFVVTSSVEQSVVARVDAKIYLWPASSKVVIAQIDGAIARTSTGGMFKRRDTSSPLHEGAQAFFSRLEQNGYHIVYLTCQGLSQAEWIRTLLRPSSSSSSTSPTSGNHPDDSSVSLPHGPVLLSPDRLLEASSNEAVDAQEFKAAALDAVRALFPPDVNAFYAAFGKTQEDAATFARAGVFPGKVFIVDESSGRLRHRSLLGFHESYSSLWVMADTMFPPILSPLAPLRDRQASSSVTSSNNASRRSSTANDALVSEAVASQVRSRSMADDAYNDVNFWRIKPGTV